MGTLRNPQQVADEEFSMGQAHRTSSPSIHSSGMVFGWCDSFQYLVVNQTPAMSGGKTSTTIIRLRRLYFRVHRLTSQRYVRDVCLRSWACDLPRSFVLRVNVT